MLIPEGDGGRANTGPGSQFDPFCGRTEPPYDEFSAMRHGGRVFRIPSGFWYLPGYEECQAALRDWRAFSNTGGMRDSGVSVPSEEQFLNEQDGPRHQRLRKLLGASLTPAKVRQAQEFTRVVAEKLIAAAVARGTADLVAEFAEPIPGTVINMLIGVPGDMQQQFKWWVDEILRGPYPRTFRGTNNQAGLKHAYPEFSDYVDGLVDDRRRALDPPDDLLSRLVHVHADGGQLTDTEIRTSLIFLIIVGNRTTAHTLGNLLARIVTDVVLFDRLRGDRSTIPAAVEESLRLDAATQFLTRTCTRDTEIADVVIPAGGRVVVGIASANRDEASFDDAATFRVDRPGPPAHLTFGMGAHFCLGAPLARMELETTLGVFFDNVSSAETVPGCPLERTPEFWTYGVKRLDARLS